MHMYSFAGLIRRTPPPTFSDTAVTDSHSDTTIFQLRAYWVRILGLLDRKNHSDLRHRPESNPRLPFVNGEHPIYLARPSALSLKSCEFKNFSLRRDKDQLTWVHSLTVIKETQHVAASERCIIY